jgi:hypothetical protein
MEGENKDKGHWFNVIIFLLVVKTLLSIYTLTKLPLSLILVLFIWVSIISPVVLSYLLYKRLSYKACIVFSILVCSSIPWGTIIGIFTIILLRKESIKAEFDSNLY